MHKYAIEIIGRGHDQLVQPSWFGDKKTKATCWWLKNLPLLVKTNDVGPAPKSGTPEYSEWAECHHASPGDDRWKARSVFYPGMADAMADQWGKSITQECSYCSGTGLGRGTLDCHMCDGFGATVQTGQDHDN